MANHERKEPSIIDLGKLAEDPKKLEEIGRRIIVEAVKAAAAQRAGNKIENPSFVRRVKRGDKVPADLIDAIGMVITPEGLAQCDWDNHWLNLIVWGRAWSENECRATIPVRDFRDPLEQIRIENILDPKEMGVLKKLKILQ